MGTNLRLPDELATALRAESARTGRSQQDIVRAAVAKELGLTRGRTRMQRAVDAGLVDEPEPYRDVAPTRRRPPGSSVHDLLDREDR